MTSVNVQFVARSSNAKTGPIPTTTTSRETCPESCPLRGDGGCYAEAGYYTRLNWDKVTNRERGSDWRALCDQVAALPDGQVWRHNVAGDLPHNRQRIDKRALGALTKANAGRRGFTYTHHDMRLKHNREAIAAANQAGFTVNLSGDSPADADALAELEIAPVVAIVPADQLENSETPAGRKIVICPAVTHEGVSCATCKLCSVADRGIIVGFPAHGARKNNINVNR